MTCTDCDSASASFKSVSQPHTRTASLRQFGDDWSKYILYQSIMSLLQMLLSSSASFTDMSNIYLKMQIFRVTTTEANEKFHFGDQERLIQSNFPHESHQLETMISKTLDCFEHRKSERQTISRNCQIRANRIKLDNYWFLGNNCFKKLEKIKNNLAIDLSKTPPFWIYASSNNK